MQKLKTILPGVIYGVVLTITVLLGYQFYKGLSLVAQHQMQLTYINDWACKKDPTSCVDTQTGKPLQAQQPAAAPATTETAPASTK